MLQVCFSGEQEPKEQKKRSHIMSRGKTGSNIPTPPPKMKTQGSGDSGAEVLPCAGLEVA